MSKENERERIYIYLEGGEEVVLEYDESVFDEIIEAVSGSMRYGIELSLDASYDVSMYYAPSDRNGYYLMTLNGRKIIGYHM